MNLDQQLLAQILGYRTNGQFSNNPNVGGADFWEQQGGIGNNNYRLYQAPNLRYVGNGDSQTPVEDGYTNYITKVREDTGGRLGDMWGTDGNYLGTFDVNSPSAELNTAIALMAAGYLGGNYLQGLEGVGAAGADAYGGAAAEILGADAAGYTPGMGLSSVGGSAAGAAGATGGGAGAGSAASAGGTLKQAVDAVGGAKTVGGLLGAAAGLADSKDKQETSSRAPWEPMQPYLLGLAEDGANLYRQYRDNPLSQGQKAAYSNIGQILDAVNSNAGGLLSGFQANASGANQFQRGQQGLLQGSNFAPTAQQWNPLNYGDFGMKWGQ